MLFIVLHIIMRTEIDFAVITRVRELRKKHGISQGVLAEALGATRGFISQIEGKGYAKYSVSQIYLIAKFFECEVSDIYPPIDRLEP